MKLNLEKRLNKTFPNLYANPVGFSHDDGWFNLLWELSEKLEPLIVQYKLDYPNQNAPFVTQAKEKYGGLRFYMSCATDDMWDYIEEAESRSYHICEICGKMSKYIKPRTIKGWMVTYCWSHAFKRWLYRTFMLKGWSDT